MKQVETRYVVVRQSDKFFWQGGDTCFFLPYIVGAKFYTTQKNAERALRNAWWFEPKHEGLFTVEPVTLTSEVQKE